MAIFQTFGSFPNSSVLEERKCVSIGEYLNGIFGYFKFFFNPRTQRISPHLFLYIISEAIFHLHLPFSVAVRIFLRHILTLAW